MKLIDTLKKAKFSQHDFNQLCTTYMLDLLYALVQDEVQNTHIVTIKEEKRTWICRDVSPAFHLARITTTNDPDRLTATTLEEVPRSALTVHFEQSFQSEISPYSLVYDYVQPIDIPTGGSAGMGLCTQHERDRIQRDVFNFFKKRKGVPEHVFDHLTTRGGLVDLPYDWIDAYVTLGGTIYKYNDCLWCVLYNFCHNTLAENKYLIPLYDVPAAYRGIESNIPVIRPKQR